MILYLHGFCSSPVSWKAKLLGETLAAKGLAAHFVCPALSTAPRQAIAQAQAIIETDGTLVTLVGSSLGGHYATWLAERYDLKAVLINPAVVQRLDADLFIGVHQNLYSGERFDFTADDARDLLAQTIEAPTADRYWLLVETGDEVLDYRHAVEHYRGCRLSLVSGGDHSFTQFPQFVSQIIEFAGL